MISYYYPVAFIISLILTITYAYRWHKHFVVYFTLTFTLIPLVNLGYVLIGRATGLEEALNAQRIIYIGGCFLIYFLMLAIFSFCQIEVSKLVRTVSLTLLSVLYCFVLTMGVAPFFYKTVTYEQKNGQYFLIREYGPAHTVFIIALLLCFILSFAAIIYTYLKKNQISRTILILLFIPETVSLCSYFASRLFLQNLNVELVPASYVFAQIMYLTIAHRTSLYDISDTVIDSVLQAGEIGFVSVDFKFRYLGSSKTARTILPELEELTVDRSARVNPFINNTLLAWLSEFCEDESKHIFYLQRGEKIFEVNIQYLYDQDKKKGYQFHISDDTERQKYVSLLNHYNTELEEEVQKKTQNLVDMHNNLILGMATMVESRDNSTGGHIRRTSEGVRILIGEIKNNTGGGLNLSDKFCADIIKAAPMHDLGKIAVDDAVLRKPGRFTPEEFEKMKMHAAEGARIVHEILKETDDDEFRILAENVAHYHHERWDGSGYPEGLSGEAIPLEARIMAIADVYDALVSKRVYKDAMSFEKADSIITEGMGKHFDKALEPYYVLARPKLEAYYSQIT